MLRVRRSGARQRRQRAHMWPSSPPAHDGAPSLVRSSIPSSTCQPPLGPGRRGQKAGSESGTTYAPGRMASPGVTRSRDNSPSPRAPAHLGTHVKRVARDTVGECGDATDHIQAKVDEQRGEIGKELRSRCELDCYEKTLLVEAAEGTEPEAADETRELNDSSPRRHIASSWLGEIDSWRLGALTRA